MNLLSFSVSPAVAVPPSVSLGYPNPLKGLDRCSSMAELKQFHSQIVRLGLSSDNDITGRVIKFCALSKSGDLVYAHQVFDKMLHPDAFIYNTLIRGYLQRGQTMECFLLYLRMLQHSVTPNNFTFPSLIRSCCIDNWVKEGRQIHAHVIKFGFLDDGFSQNNLIYMYVSFGYLEDARKVFDRMPRKDAISWTTLISGYSQLGLVNDACEFFRSMPDKNSAAWNAMIAAFVQHNRFHEAFALFNEMRAEDVELDKYVVASMLSACTGLGALEQGEWIHGYIEKNRIEIDTKLGTTIIDMYCKCGSIEKAFQVFKGFPSKGISTWNCMIGGLAMHGRGQDAIELFKDMEDAMVQPDGITFLNVLNACAHSGLVDTGRHYFKYMTQVHGIEPGMEHYGCMVDLLGRAGLLEEAENLIEEMSMDADAGVLGALVGACKIHGNIELGEKVGKKVIELDPNNSGRYVLLANLYAKAGRWEDVAKVRRLMNDRGVKKCPGFSVIELDGIVSEFIAGGRAHPESREIYAKVDEVVGRIRSIGYVPDTDGVLQDIEDDEEKENPLLFHSEKLAIAYGLLKSKAGQPIRISKNLRVCRDCHQASKLISMAFQCDIIVRDRNRFHHFRNGQCSCGDFW